MNESTTTMDAPAGRSKLREIINPVIDPKTLITAAIGITCENLFARLLAVAAGARSNAESIIRPTALIAAITVMLKKMFIRYSFFLTFIPCR